MPWEKLPALELAAVEQPHHVQHLGDALLGDVAVHLAQQAEVPASGHVAVEHGVVDEAAQMAQRALPVAGGPCGRAPARTRLVG